ncbi:hypothetical protein VMT65_22650 [Nocardia sp. CDC153]|uniref:AMIN-like domain-containing (lipo)protein n=1 Tax=Nocardia sp. CDC153 TaxID=3112167 RepID=UPI002DBE1973|nr:hypothetical protein [Nocardia sp. CDC153]MEC3955851.1 hypothetical protein [Nocardia sp. CDC153]
MDGRCARSTVLAAVSLVLAGSVAACGGGSDTQPNQPVTVTTTETVDEFAARDRTPDPGAVGIGLTSITLAHTNSADQVTFEFTGASIPGWAVHYVNQPIQNGTRAAFPVTGESVIEVLIREAANPFGSGAPAYSGPQVVTDAGTVAVGEVRYASQVRGVTQAFIGLVTPQRKFRVTGLTNPTRVVVEIDHR